MLAELRGQNFRHVRQTWTTN